MRTVQIVCSVVVRCAPRKSHSYGAHHIDGVLGRFIRCAPSESHSSGAHHIDCICAVCTGYIAFKWCAPHRCGPWARCTVCTASISFERCTPHILSRQGNVVSARARLHGVHQIDCLCSCQGRALKLSYTSYLRGVHHTYDNSSQLC